MAAHRSESVTPTCSEATIQVHREPSTPLRAVPLPREDAWEDLSVVSFWAGGRCLGLLSQTVEQP
jgi:hypothetical protein